MTRTELSVTPAIVAVDLPSTSCMSHCESKFRACTYLRGATLPEKKVKTPSHTERTYWLPRRLSDYPEKSPMIKYFCLQQFARRLHRLRRVVPAAPSVSARRCLTSRKIAATPTVLPSASRNGRTENSTGIRRPSLWMAGTAIVRPAP
jgi:hypothetical protein